MVCRYSLFRRLSPPRVLRCSFADEPRSGLIQPKSFHVPKGSPSGRPPKERRPKSWLPVWLLLLAVGVGAILALLAGGREEGRSSLPEDLPHPNSSVVTEPGTGILSVGPDEVGATNDIVLSPQELNRVESAAMKPDESGGTQVDAQARRSANGALEEFLVKRHELERRGVAEWGGDAYESVQQQSEEADDLMLRRSYAEARERYQTAAADCDTLLADTPAVLMQLLREGAEAFERTNGVLAVRKFEAGTQLDPASTVARESLRRARTLDQVGGLLRSAASHERRKSWGEALTDYQEAVDLDPQFEAASAGLARVTRAMKDERFQTLMSEGLQALQDGTLDRAETILQRAEVLKPGSRDIRNALFQVEEARRVLRIRAAQEEAIDAERVGDWERAYTLHKRVLVLDPHVQASLQGRDRNASRVRLIQQMSAYVKDPRLLRSEEGRGKAGAILAEAGHLSDEVASWKALMAALGEELRLASTPVRLVMTSDGFTEVDVYRVGRFGVFQRHTVSVLPGTYTVVGHRKGYQDKRLQVTVEPGDEVEIAVACQDRI